jgi:fibronectin-binding autotransporter adhesin
VHRPRPLGVSLARFTSVAAVCGALIAGLGSARAATYYWDADGSITGNNFTTGFGLGGSGIWNTSLLNWWDTSADLAWPNLAAGDIAFFTGASGVVQLGGNITAGGLTFNSAGYNITDGTAGSRLTLAGGAAVQANVVGTNTISAVLDGTSGLTLTGSGLNSVISLANAANIYTGTNVITSGTLSIASDGSLGNAANGISFNGAALGGLTFAQSMSLGAARTVTLGTGATATLTSALNSNVNVLGQVTGAGSLTVVNTGVTGLLATTNDFSGALWSQGGTVALNALTDAVGSGSIKLGNAATTGAFQWASGAGSALSLTNRAVELAGATGGGTLDSAAMTAANSITINSNLLVSGVGAKTLTLTGANAGTNTFAGGIGDSSSRRDGRDEGRDELVGAQRQ